MADKQIVIDYKTLCENYSKEVGCCNTFDGSCSKEECFTYRLLQLLQAKEKECEGLKATLKVIADRSCLNIYVCDGNCLPHCKWNAHKLAQEALKELE